MRVTLTLIPLSSRASTAGSPSVVAGTLIMRLGLATRCQRRFASATVPAASWARWGDTSRLTKPSPPPDASYTGASTSAAERMSDTTSSS